MGCRVDEEGGVMNNDDSEQSTPDETTHEPGKATEEEPSCHTWEDHADEESYQEDVSVLESKNWICLKVVDLFHSLFFLSNHHPSDMGPEKALEDRIRIVIGICDEVVTSVIAAPLDGRVLESSSTEEGVEQSQRPSGFVGAVGEQTVVASGD